jgi:phosphoglycerate dehydrogenase-like enzyme
MDKVVITPHAAAASDVAALFRHVATGRSSGSKAASRWSIWSIAAQGID